MSLSFAFEFLMDIAERLKQAKTEDPYRSLVQRRIERVCKGHILWLSNTAEISPYTRCLKGDHLVNGRAIYETTESKEFDSADSYVPVDAITDQPFNIIKACRAVNYYGKIPSFTFLELISTPWLSMLGKTDKRGRFAWPHRSTNETNLFRLDDHVWIWRALQCLEEAGVWEEIRRIVPNSDDKVHGEGEFEDDDEQEHTDDSADDTATSVWDEIERLVKFYSSAKVRKGTLQRFTTLENDITHHRMLAVARSSQQTRFLFHARDTSLFYGEQCGYFSRIKGLWETTIAAQRLHSESDESSWDNAIRYALGIIMGTNDWSFGGLGPEDLVKHSVDVLFGSTSPNAFFPGQLDEATLRPTLFYRDRFRDFYFHASFEVPYVLLTHANRICDCYESKTSKLPELSVSLGQGANTDHHPPRFETNQPNSISYETRNQDVRIVAPTQQKTGMKKNMPFGSRVDQRSIVELTDEWLYPYPAFLEDPGKWAIIEPRRSNESIGEVIDSFLKTGRGPVPDWWDKGLATVVDTGQKKRGRQRDEGEDNLDGYFLTNDNLRRFLDKPRTAAKSKKRFIWLPQADPRSAHICYEATPDVVKQSLSLFFDRHSRYDNFFNDNPTRISNTWETEMHLSFYLLIDYDPISASRSIPDPHQADFPGSNFTARSGGDSSRVNTEFRRRQIARASVGFYFDGDFFDRYWTCHFVEHNPKWRWDWDFPFDRQAKGARGKNWRQRKVLELHLCDRILGLILSGSDAILSEARQALHIEPGFLTYTVHDDDEFKRRNDLWESIQPILRTVNDELSAASSTLSKWALREKDREAESPRWTRNDERKYRGIINKLTGSTSRKITDVERVLKRIQSLEEFLDSYFDKTRTRLSNDNMVTFTYVTVIFLPLGFAASIFSMGGAPDSSLLISMIICAVVAFVLTVILLINAKNLLGVLNRIFIRRLKALWGGIVIEFKKLDQTSRRKMHASEIFQSYQNRQFGTTDGGRSVASDQHQESSTKMERQVKISNKQTPLHWLFWPVYLLVEVPAQMILIACRALQKKNASFSVISHIAAGFLFLPLFIFSWLVQIVFYNLADLIHITTGQCIHIFAYTLSLYVPLTSQSQSLGQFPSLAYVDQSKAMGECPSHNSYIA